MSKAIIEGRLDAEIDESDSDPDSDEDNPRRVNNAPAATVVAVRDESDDEEEIEYFGSGNAPEGAAAGGKSSGTTKVETAPSTRPAATNDSDGDGFGIRYQPMHKKNTDSVAPPSVFEAIDTTEIEQRLLSNAAAARQNNEKEEDDEFGFDESSSEHNEGASEAPQNNDSKHREQLDHIAAVRKAIEVVAANYSETQAEEEDQMKRAITAEELQRRLAAEEESGMVEGRFQDPEAPVVMSSESTDTDRPTSATAEVGLQAKKNILEEARKALAEVTDVYGSGLGDQEVLLLSKDGGANAGDNLKGNDSRSAASTLSAPAMSGGAKLGVQAGGIIEEGDEEAAELEESEEEMMARIKNIELEIEQRRVEQEWEKVAAEAAPPPPPALQTSPIPSRSAAAMAVTTPESPHPSADSRDGSSKYMSALADTTEDFFGGGAMDDDDVAEMHRAREKQLARAGSKYTKSSDTFMSYSKSLTFFVNQDLSSYAANIVTSEPRPKSGWFVGGAPKPINYPGFTSRDLNMPFLIAQVDFDASVAPMLNMLLSIYNFFLENMGRNPSAVGDHWEKIGFQGTDPRTDLNRSMKMLSVIQMLSFLETDALLARKLFDMSQSATPAPARSDKQAVRNDTSWPFMCVSIMFTKEALQALRRGDLNEKCNKRKSVLNTLNEFHRAIFAEFYRLLEEDPKLHHAIHLNAVRKSCEAVGGAVKLMKKYKALVAAGHAPILASQSIPHSSATAAVGASKSSETDSTIAELSSNPPPTALSAVAVTSKTVDTSESAAPMPPMPPMPDMSFDGDDIEFDSIDKMREVSADEAIDAAATARKKKAAKFQAV